MSWTILQICGNRGKNRGRGKKRDRERKKERQREDVVKPLSFKTRMVQEISKSCKTA
jgi:hypothetical protein